MKIVRPLIVGNRIEGMHYSGMTEGELTIQLHKRKFRTRHTGWQHMHSVHVTRNFYIIDLTAENLTWERFSVQ
jgi:hypothetical protein